MEFHLPEEVTQNIKAYIPRGKDMFSPTSHVMKPFIKTVNDLTTIPPELTWLRCWVNNDASFSRKVFDVLDVLGDYGILSDLSNLSGDLYIR
jgi:hypothetical protein